MVEETVETTEDAPTEGKGEYREKYNEGRPKTKGKGKEGKGN